MGTIRVAGAADAPALRSILAACGLPADDLPPHLGGTGPTDAVFFLAEEGGATVGVIGLERHPPAGLLRSAGVVPARRRGGIGGKLVEEAVREAERSGLGELVLLTTTAARWFAGRGFETIARESLSGPILSSGQFTGERCSSAAVMRRRIAAGAGGPPR